MVRGGSLSETHPELRLLWDFERNGTLTPDDVAAGSAKLVYWNCKEGHSTRSEIRGKVQGSGCGVCLNRILLSGYNDLATCFPQIAKQWHPSKNGALTATEVLFGSRTNAWWQCERGHEWQAWLYSRDPKTQGCKACLNKVVVKGENDLESRFPDIASEWDSEKNGKTKPSDVTFGSPSSFYWKCSKGHSFKLSVYKRTKDSSACKFCSGNAIEPGVSDIQTLYPEISKKFDQTLNPSTKVDEIAPHSKKRYIWNCDKGHTFTSTPQQLIKGQGCGVCSGKQLLAGFNDITTKFPMAAKEWSPKLNDGLEASMFAPGSSKIVWWHCPKGHDYKMRIDNRCFLNRQCAVCANRQVQRGINDLATHNPNLAREWDRDKNGDLLPADVAYESTHKAWWLCIEGHSFHSQINFRATRDVGCPNCSKSGFDQSSPSLFYFIENRKLAARKVGIANKSSKRLAKWTSKGWTVLYTAESEIGTSVLDLETQTLRWIRKDLFLPPFLGDEELGAIGGWSETFSIEGVTNSEVISRIEECWSVILAK